jgi:hypothetical protein
MIRAAQHMQTHERLCGFAGAVLLAASVAAKDWQAAAPCFPAKRLLPPPWQRISVASFAERAVI